MTILFRRHQQPVVANSSVSPGSSWHTPQGMNNPVPAQVVGNQAGNSSDNSFKIVLPGAGGANPQPALDRPIKTRRESR